MSDCEGCAAMKRAAEKIAALNVRRDDAKKRQKAIEAEIEQLDRDWQAARQEWRDAAHGQRQRHGEQPPT